MAESRPSLGRSILIGSDQLLDNFCEPCYEASDKIKPVAGYCNDCDVNLCLECFTSHRGLKIFRTHKLVDRIARPKSESASQAKLQNVVEECILHQGEIIYAYCLPHSEVICKVCFTIGHENCRTEELSKLATNIQDSKDLRNLEKKLRKLEKGFNDNHRKTGANELVIQRNHGEALNAMKKIRDKFDKLMTETENQADIVQAEDLAKLEKMSATCDIVVKQINNLTTRLETLKENNEHGRLFIAIKRTENQLQSLEEKLDIVVNHNTVREYKFEPDEKLISMLNDTTVLGRMSFIIPQIVSKINQKAKKPTYCKDINVMTSSDKKCRLYSSVLLPNHRILITDLDNKKLKLIDTNQDTIISELLVSGIPMDLTKVKGQIAVTANDPNTIQVISVCQTSMYKVREFTVKGICQDIAYSDNDNTLIVVFVNPSEIKILDMAGNELKCIETNFTNRVVLTCPEYVALTPDMTNMYISHGGLDNDYVIKMSLNGDVKSLFRDNRLDEPYGICLHRSGLLYIAGNRSNTIHHLDPDSGEFKVLLENTDGIDAPLSISYCENEDKLYIGMEQSVLKVYQMKSEYY